MKTFEELMAELSGPPPGASSVMDSYAAPSSPVKTFEELMAELKGPPPPPPPPELLRAPAPEPIVPLPSTQSIFDQQPQAALGAAPPVPALPAYQPPPAPEPYVSPVKPLPLADQFPMRQTALTTPEIVQPAPAVPIVSPPPEKPGFLSNVAESFGRGYKGADLDLEAYNAAIGLADWNEVSKKRKAFEAEQQANPIKGDNPLSEAIYGVAGMAGPMAQGVIEGGIAGATAGAVTVNPLVIAGLTSAGTLQYWYRQGAGSFYASLRDQGVPHDIASATSQVFGLGYAAIEESQVTKIVPGAKGLEKRLLDQAATKTIARITAKYGLDIATETGEEVAQEATQIAAEELGKALSNAKNDTNLPQTDWNTVKDRLSNTAAQSIGPLALMVGPAGMVRGRRLLQARTQINEGIAILTDEEKKASGWDGMTDAEIFRQVVNPEGKEEQQVKARIVAKPNLTPEDAATQAQALKNVTGRSPLTATGEPVPVTDETDGQRVALERAQEVATNPPTEEEIYRLRDLAATSTVGGTRQTEYLQQATKTREGYDRVRQILESRQKTTPEVATAPPEGAKAAEAQTPAPATEQPTERQATPVPLQIEPKKFTFAARAIHAAVDETGVDAALQSFDAARNTSLISDQTYEREHAKLLDIADRRLQALEEERQRADLEQAATSQPGTETSETGNIPTATGKIPEVSGEIPTETQGNVPKTQQNATPESIDLRGAGTAIADNLHDMLWEKVQKGDITEAGAPSRALIAAKEERAKGGLNTKEEARAFFQRYATQQNATPERPASPPEPAKVEPAPITPTGDIAAPAPPQKAPEPEVDEFDITTPLPTPAEELAPQVDEPVVESETAKRVLDGYLEMFPALREVLTGVDDHTQYPAQALRLAQAQGHADLSKMDAVTYTDVDGKEKVAINVGMLKGNPLEVVAKVAHEVGIHLGLEKALGKEGLQEFGQTVFHTMSPEQQQAISQSHKYDLEKDQHQIGQEHAAIEAERLIREGTAYKGTEAWSKIVAAARAAWRSFVTKSGLAFNPSALPFTDRELAVALTKGWKAATTPTSATADLAAKGQSVDQPGLRASVTPKQARGLNYQTKLPDDPIFTSAVKGTPGAEITEGGLLIDVARYQTTEQAGEPSVRTGVFYLPGGSPNLKFFKAKSSSPYGAPAYGGTEKMEGKTLIRRPLFVKGAVGGKAGEAAFEQIEGKGAIKKLEEEMRPLYLYAKQEDNGRAFLGRHGVDPDMWPNIYNNSRSGNRMRYALQEVVVAHAVRNAGYDAVVGYSTKRGGAGHFISEIFDVREVNYPYDPQGAEDVDIHPKFRASVSKQPAAPAPVFYSQVERTIDEKMQNRARSTDVLKMLENTQGVKGEELEWTKLKDFLSEGKVVTKQEVKDFLAENQVVIEEVVKGRDKSDYNYSTPEEWQSAIDRAESRGNFDEAERINRAWEGVNEETGSAKGMPQFANYTLPGGESYRELLLTMPPQSATGKEQYEIFPKTGKDLYYSPHYDEPNILAHIRFNERTDDEGKRVMFLEEVQSDWHQAGRDKGYTVPPKRRTASQDARLKELLVKPSAERTAEEKAEVPILIRANAEGVRGYVPDAPFKKTWHELAMKRALRWAAENGFDRVAWTTGAQQAERYDLAKQVDYIEYSDRGEGNYSAIAYKDGSPLHETEVDEKPASELAAMFGKDIASRIVNGEGRASSEDAGSKVLEGDNLKVGGEGMKVFYDQMLPTFVNKYAKKWGAKVGETRILRDPTQSDPQIQRIEQALTEARSAPQDEYTAAEIAQGERDLADAKARQSIIAEGYAVHSVDVSPAMRESVMGGQARFSVSLDKPVRPGVIQKDVKNSPDELSTRMPWVKKEVMPTDDEIFVSDLANIYDRADRTKEVADYVKKTAQLVRGNPNTTEADAALGDKEVIEKFISHLKENILWLYDQVPEDIRGQSKRWYDGGEKIATRWGEKYKIKARQVAGVIAVLSPQRDWFQNVSAAERILDALTQAKDIAWTPEMESHADTILQKVAPGLKGQKLKTAQDHQRALASIRGKTLADISDVYDKAVFIRIYDEVHNDRSYKIVTPEGEFGETKTTDSGEIGTMSWGSFNEIAKAIKIYENGGLFNITVQLGTQHKVRNFYNNIIAPNSKAGHVTIDTHAVAGALLRIIAASPTKNNPAEEANQNFGGKGSSTNGHTGTVGTYPLYYEAYRQAAIERGILPREMQSITWEATRGLFKPSTKRGTKILRLTNEVWAQHKRGEISTDEARKEILRLAGGISPPAWFRSGADADVQAQSAADPGNLPGSELRDEGLREGTAGIGGVGRNTGTTEAAGVSPPEGTLRASVSKPTNTPQEDAAQVRTALYGTDPEAAVQALRDVHLGHGKEDTPEALKEVWGERIERANAKKPLDPAVYAAVQRAMTEPTPAAEQKEPLKKGWKERSFPGTLEEAGLPPGEDLIYRVISNKESAAAGRKAWMDDPEDAEKVALADPKGGGSAKHTAISIVVIAGRQQQYTETRQQAQAATDPEQKKALEEKADRYLSSALAVASKTAERMTKAGQQIQAARLLQVLTPESLIFKANREIDKINEDVTDEKKRQRLPRETVDRLIGKAKLLAEWSVMGDKMQDLQNLAHELSAAGTTPSAEKIQAFRALHREVRELIGPQLAPRAESTRTTPTPQASQGTIPGATTPPQARYKTLQVRIVKDAANAARERLKAKGYNIQAGVDPADLRDIALIGMDHFVNGPLKFVAWAAEMTKGGFSVEDNPDWRQAYGMSRAEFARNTRLARKADALLVKIEEQMQRIENDPRIVSTPDVEVIREAMDAVKKLAGEEQVALAGEIHGVIRALHAPTAGEKITAGLHIARLLNPKTIGRNIIGNELFWRTERLKHATAAALDYAYSKGTGKERAVTYAAAGGTYLADLAVGARLAWRGVNPGGLDTGFDLPTQRAFKGKIMGTLEKSLGVAMRATDYAAAERARKSVINEFATRAMREQGFAGDAKAQARWKAEWAEKADNNINELAREYGKYATFQDENAISKLAVDTQRLMRGAAPFIMPYARTPANLLARGLDYSPVGLTKGLWIAGRNQWKGKGVDRRQLLFDLSRGMVGTGFGALGWMLMGLGIISGAGDDDPEAKRLKAEQTGERGYQVNLDALIRFFASGFDESAAKRRNGDTLVSYDWAMPMSMAFGTGANIYEAVKTKELKKGGINLAETAVASVTGAMSMVADQPMMQALRDLGSMAGDRGGQRGIGGNIYYMVEGLPASFIPTIVNQARQLKDNAARETTAPDMYTGMVNRVMNKMPWASEELPKVYKSLGIDVPKEIYQNGGNGLVNVFLNPAFVAEYKIDPLVTTFLAPYEAERKTDQFPRVQRKDIAISKTDLSQVTGKMEEEGVKIDLTGADRQEMQRMMTGWTTRKMAEVEKGKYLQGKTPTQQVEIVAKYVLNPAADQARQWFVKNRLQSYLKK